MTNNQDENNICSQWAEFISAYIDGQLDDKQIDELEKHLQQCKICTDRLEQYTRIKKMMEVDRHNCPADIASIVMANVERNNLLDGLNLLARPASPWWVKFLKVASAAAMIALAVSTIFVVMYFTNQEKIRNGTLPATPVREMSPILSHKTVKTTVKENLPQQVKPLRAKRKMGRAKSFKSPAAGLAVMPAYKSSDIVSRTPESLTKIIPWKIFVYADTPMLMLIKEQLTELLWSEKISAIEQLEIEQAIKNKRNWFYSMKYYEISNSSHYAEVLVLARADKIKKIYAKLVTEQIDNASLTISNQFENFLQGENLEDSKLLADVGNVITKIADYFAIALTMQTRSATTTSIQATARNARVQLFPVLIILQKEHHLPAITTTRNVATTRSTQSSRPVLTTKSILTTKPE